MRWLQLLLALSKDATLKCISDSCVSASLSQILMIRFLYCKMIQETMLHHQAINGWPVGKLYNKWGIMSPSQKGIVLHLMCARYARNLAHDSSKKFDDDSKTLLGETREKSGSLNMLDLEYFKGGWAFGK